MFCSDVHNKICSDCHYIKIASTVTHISIVTFTKFSSDIYYWTTLFFVQPKGIIQWWMPLLMSATIFTIFLCSEGHYIDYQVVIFISYKLKSSHIIMKNSAVHCNWKVVTVTT